MKQFLLVFLPLLFISVLCYSQKQGNVWYFGQYAGLNFNSGSPVPLSNGQMSTLEGCLSVADKNTGQILFYSDGDSIWDRNGNVMPNGQGLLGNFSSTQSGIIVPMPGSNTKYYVFTVDAQAGLMPPYGPSTTGFGGLAYNIVDMTLNGGNGDISLKNQELIAPTCEKVNCIKHCNGVDYWVVTHQWDTDAFYAYLITSAGVQPPVISNPGGVIPQDPSGLYVNGQAIGYLKFSHDGTKLACAHYVDINTVEIFDFNNSIGIVSNPVQDTNFPDISGEDGPYGVTFSPDDSKLYVGYLQYDSVYEFGFWETYGGVNQIYQYNMQAGSGAAIVASRTTVASRMDVAYGALQCAPDGKIYVANESETANSGGWNYLDVISNPNGLGAACNYQQDALYINTGGDNQCLFGLPDIIDAFFIPPHVATLTYPTGCTTTDTVAFEDSLTGNVTFLWNFDDPNSGLKDTSSLQNPNHTFSANGTYTVKIIFTNICKADTFSRSVTVNNTTLTVTAAPNVSICSGASANINLTATPAVGITYSWAPAAGLNCTSCQDVIATPVSNTTYIVTASNSGCKAKDTIVVSIITKVVATVSNDTTVCGGSNVQLKAGGGNAYSWSPSTGLSNSTISNPVATPAGTTTYKVVVSGGTCGSDSANVTITIIPAATVNAGNDTTICNGTSAQLNATGNNINTYSWAPATALSCVTCANPVASPTIATSYTVTVNAGTACPASANININVINSVVAKVNNDTTVCFGNSVQLLASGGSNYTWSPPKWLNNTTIASPLSTPDSTITYSVTVTGGTCGSDSAKVTITVIPAATINAGNDTSICTGSTAQLNATGNNINTYLWTPATGLSCVTCANSLANPTVTTSYTVTANAATACPVSASINITVINNVVAKINDDTTICSGNSVQLLASGGASYTWSPAKWINNDTIASPLSTPDSTITYSATVTGGGACGSDSAKTTITVIPQPVITLGPAITICRGGNVQLTTTGTNITSYTWAPATGLSCTTCASPFAGPDTTTLYGVVANFGSMCLAADTQRVYVDTAVQLKAGPDTAICIGSSVKMLASGGTTYQWMPSAGLSDSTIANPVANPTVTTIYSITVTGSSCPVSTLFDTVTVNPLPLVSAGPDTSIAIGSSVQLYAAGQGTSFYWYPYVGLNIGYVSNPIASPTVTTTYIVYATDQNGCTDTASAIVNVYQLPYVIFPNAFSPNGDGINDVFIPHYYEIQSYDVKIFDRWGELIFESQNPDLGWDGKFNGRDASIGAYVYVAKAVTDAGVEINKKGNFVLLR